MLYRLVSCGMVFCLYLFVVCCMVYCSCRLVACRLVYLFVSSRCMLYDVLFVSCLMSPLRGMTDHTTAQRIAHGIGRDETRRDETMTRRQHAPSDEMRQKTRRHHTPSNEMRQGQDIIRHHIKWATPPAPRRVVVQYSEMWCMMTSCLICDVVA